MGTKKHLGILLGLSLGTVAIVPVGAEAQQVRVIVGSQPGQSTAVEKLVTNAGGTVVGQLTALDMTVVDIPASALNRLARQPAVTSLTVDASVRLANQGNGNGNGRGREQSDANRSAIDVDGPRSRGVNGSGIDVAIIDSGVSPVPGLAGRIVNAPDFSADAGVAGMAGLDAFGHGTHLAGLIAGADPTTGFTGIAPSSRIVNVKAAAHDGMTSVESVLSSINWVVENSNKNGLNIRVLNLSLGLDPEDSYVGDPLSQAVEKAWKKDIVVVVSAGNGGGQTQTLQSPAINPYIIAVAAEDTKATADKADDTIATFTSNGSSARMPDVVAPGVGMVSLRVPGSALDEAFPEGRIDETLFRGNGTSQAAAVTSGAAALILQNNPKMKPDQVKALLMGTAVPIAGVSPTLQGAGRINLSAATATAPPDAKQVEQKWETAGKIDLKKLDKLNKKAKDGKSSKSLEAEALTGNRWTGNRWTGNRWTGNRWTGSGWS
jgi:serine protease AprX